MVDRYTGVQCTVTDTQASGLWEIRERTADSWSLWTDRQTDLRTLQCDPRHILHSSDKSPRMRKFMGRAGPHRAFRVLPFALHSPHSPQRRVLSFSFLPLSKTVMVSLLQKFPAGMNTSLGLWANRQTPQSAGSAPKDSIGHHECFLHLNAFKSHKPAHFHFVLLEDLNASSRLRFLAIKIA